MDERRIRSLLRDEETGCISNLESDNPRLIVAWGGLSRGLGPVRPFEFFRSLSELDVKTAFLRDHEEAWYHKGVRGVGSDIDSVATYVHDLATRAEDAVMIGNSAGGYAALMFGALLGCEVHALNPQTFISPELRRKYGDERWAEQLGKVDRKLDTRYVDLLPLLRESKGSFHLYYSTRNPLDGEHAGRVASLENVRLYPIESDDHDAIRRLRDEGWLHTWLEGIASGSLPTSPQPASAPRTTG